MFNNNLWDHNHDVTWVLRCEVHVDWLNSAETVNVVQPGLTIIIHGTGLRLFVESVVMNHLHAWAYITKTGSGDQFLSLPPSLALPCAERARARADWQHPAAQDRLKPVWMKTLPLPTLHPEHYQPCTKGRKQCMSSVLSDRKMGR